MFFLNGAGGTGKTYVYKTLYYKLIGANIKVLNMAYTGIAATLLPQGRTAHKTFALDVPLTPESISRIKNNSKKADALREIDVFFLDEAPMLPKYGMENMDVLLRMLHANPDVPFGGVIMIFGGDFRQCLPVQPRANVSELVDLSIKRSHLWEYFKIFTLRRNERLEKEEEDFAKFLIKVLNIRIY